MFEKQDDKKAIIKEGVCYKRKDDRGKALNFINVIKTLSAVILTLLVCWALYGQVNQLINPYPGEYRDGAPAYMAKQIYDGVNPYSMKNVTYSNAYVYGPVMPCIAAGIMRLTGLSALTSLKIVDFFFLLALVVLIALSIYWYSRSLFFSLLGPAIYMGFCQVSPLPDHMGMFLEIVCIICLGRTMASRKKQYWIYGFVAVFTVVLFYIKVTYVLIAIPIFITLWMDDRKGAIIYALTGIVVGGGSLLVLYIVYPLALINMIYMQMIEKSNILTFEGLLRATKKYADFGKRYFIFIVMSIGAFIFNIIGKKRKDGEMILVPRIFVVSVVTLLILLFYMAFGKGGSYHNELIGPSLVIIGCICGAGQMEKCKRGILWCLLFGCIVCAAWGSANCVERPNSEQENANWEKMYALLDDYVEDGRELYLSSELACYAVDHDLPVYDNGHGYYLMIGTRGFIPGLYDVGEKYKWLVPALGELNIRAVELSEALRTKIISREFGAVVGQFNEGVFMAEVYDNYICVDSVTLRMGSEIVESKIYVPK